MDNKENERFPSVSDAAIDKLATECIHENTEKMTICMQVGRYHLLGWRYVHNAQHTSDKCLDNLLDKCEAGALNKWLSGFTAGVSPADGSPHPSKIIQIHLVRLL